MIGSPSSLMATLAIDPTSGTYPSGTPISIVCLEQDAEIYFTLDGSPPSPGSKRYRGPIPLGPDTTSNGKMRLRAVAVDPDGRSSPVTAADFERAAGISIRFRKPSDWSSAFVHYWGTEPDGLFTEWPGQPMSSQGDGWYRFELPGQISASLVLNDSGGAQTRDLRVDTPDAWLVGEDCWDIDPARFSGFLFPGGVTKALVLSMDDGPVQDRRLVELLNRHGIRGTFYLNSGRLGQPDYVSADEVASLYAGHEVSTHSVTHPYLDSLSPDEIATEVDFDRAVLSQIWGDEVRGHAYPFGARNYAVIEVLRRLGFAYARTASSTGRFALPSDPLAWNPTCHHSVASSLVDAFYAAPDSSLALFFIYGHSWELDAGKSTNSWAYMESLAQRLGGQSDIWYATAIEVADYVCAMRSVRSCLAEDRLYNPCRADLWLRGEQSVVPLPAGNSVEGTFGIRS
jgi:peptidoglycan/xylan/chitin deacetylase (PgdA/CDA1 family)